MRSMQVVELMVPIAEYATVGEDASLAEAIAVLTEAGSRPGGYPHLSVLVLGPDGNVIGRIGHYETLKALEPGYLDPEKFEAMRGWGFSEGFIASMLRDQGMFEAPLDRLCAKVAEIKVGKLMAGHAPDQNVPAGTALDVAIHKLVLLCVDHLLVTDKGRTVGVLRLCDVFAAVAKGIVSCER